MENKITFEQREKIREKALDLMNPIEFDVETEEELHRIMCKREHTSSYLIAYLIRTAKIKKISEKEIKKYHKLNMLINRAEYGSDFDYSLLLDGEIGYDFSKDERIIVVHNEKLPLNK